MFARVPSVARADGTRQGKKVPNRILRDSITESDSLSRLTAEEERLFYRLISKADD